MTTPPKIIASFNDHAWRQMLTRELATQSVQGGLVAVVQETEVPFSTVNLVRHGDYSLCIYSNYWAFARWLRRRCEKWLRDCQIRGWLVDSKTGEVHTDGVVWPNIYSFAEDHGFGTRGRRKENTPEAAVDEEIKRKEKT